APAIPPGVRNLAGGNPDPRLLPDLRPALATAAERLTRGRAHLYGESEADPELLERLTDGFAADAIAADHVVLVGGALDGLARALQAHLRPGDRVAVEDPGYCGTLDVLEACDLRAVAVPIDDRGALPAQLERVLGQVQAVALTPRLHSPTGAATDA